MTRPSTPRSAAATAQDERWAAFVAGLLRSPRAFSEQLAAYRSIYADRRSEDGPPLAWRPDPSAAADSNLAQLMRHRGTERYEDLYAWSVADRAGFWSCVLERLGISFERRPDEILNLAEGPEHPRWLPGARFNIVESCLAAAPDLPAIVTGTSAKQRVVSYGELRVLVARMAGGLRALGYREDDAVALYMPMTTECVVAYLAVVAIGARVVSIADSFSAQELKRRLELADARGIVTVAAYARGGRRLEPYAKVREAQGPPAIVVDGDARAPALRPGDRAWTSVLVGADDLVCALGDPGHVSNVLFSSGTTAEPKAIPWTHVTPLKCAMDGHFHHDIRPGDVVAWPTNVGWMMGPWLIYAALINRATIALHDGAPNDEDFAGFIGASGVSMLGLVPSLVRAWREAGTLEPGQWPSLRVFSSTGEPSNREDYLWLMSRCHHRLPVIEYLGGTEIGGGHVTGTVLQAASPSTFTTPALGTAFVLIDDEGNSVPPGAAGELFLVPPSLGSSERLLNRDHHEAYFADCPPGPAGELLRRHGDLFESLHHGFFRARGRADDSMNLGGIKVGSLELEQAVAAHAAVRDCAAVGVQLGAEGAERLVVFAVLREPRPLADLRAEIGGLIAGRLNPLFKLHDLVVVDALPRTASNKLLRRELKRSYSEQPSG